MTATAWYWVRHGPTHQKTMCGWRDVPADLSDGAALAALRAALPKDAVVVSSDLARARDTADAIAGDRPRLPDMTDLRELHFGAWEGLTAAEAEARDGPAIRAFWEDPGARRAPGGESWNDLHARVRRAVRALDGAAPAVVVVAHMGVIMSRLEIALRLTPYQALGHVVPPLSLTILPGAGSAADPVLPHLPARPR